MKAEEALALLETTCDHHLSKLQVVILQHAWEEQSYQDIARLTGYEVGYIKQIGAQLWRQLSDRFGERVTKHNLHQVLSRHRSPSSPPSPSPPSSSPSLSPPPPISPTPTPQTSWTDWSDAPDILPFYGRTTEQETLAHWLIHDRCRWVALLGLGGIGKTTLAIQIARQLQPQFDWVIWRSLQHRPALHELLADLLRALVQPAPDPSIPPSLDTSLRSLLEQLRQSRGLLILDNAETIMQSGHLVGRYSAPYEDYSQLWRYLGEREHQSAVLLTSREQPWEMTLMEGPTLPVRSLRLQGVSPQAGQQLMQSKGNFAGTTDHWQALVNHYGGNPLALKMVAGVILHCFDGQVAAFLDLLQQGHAVFDDVRQLLAGQVNRLTPLERQVLYWLAIYRDPVTFNELRVDLHPSVPLSDLLEALTSLQARSLIEKQSGRFTLQPVVMEYLTEALVQQASIEILGLGSAESHHSLNSSVALLRTHALLTAQAPDYRREAQRRFLLQAIAEQCLRTSSIEAIVTAIRTFLDQLRGQPAQQTGYLVGNLLNLLIHLQVDLTGWDLSQLPIWQADLRGVTLHQVNFSGADLSRSVFTEAFGQILSVAFSPDGKLLATGDVNHEIRVWQVADGKPLATLQMPEGWVWSVAFSPNGRLLASSANRTVSLWDVQTGTCVQTLQSEADRVFSLAFSPDGQLLASGSEDRVIRVWEVKTQRLIRVLKGHDDEVRSIAFAPHRYVETPVDLTDYRREPQQGHLLASGSSDRTVRLWDVQTGTCCQILRGHTDGVWSIAFSLDGQVLASGSRDRTVKLWQVRTGTCQQTLSDHPQQIRTLAFAPDGKTLATGCDDHQIRLWNYQTGECLHRLHGHRSWITALAFSPENGVLASGSEDQSVRLWESQSYRCMQTVQGHSNGVWNITFDSTGQRLASGHQDGRIRLWSLNEAIAPHPIRVLQGHESWVWSVAFHPQGHFCASGSEDRTVRLWDSATGKSLHTCWGHTDAVFSVIFSLDGETLISGSLDGTLRLWNASTARCERILRGHRSGIWAIALSPEGRYLASGSQDATTRLWDLTTGQCVRVLADHPGWIRSVTFSPHGSLLATGSADGLIQIWDWTNGIPGPAIAAQSGPVLALAFDPHQLILVSSGTDAALQFWRWHRDPVGKIQLTPVNPSTQVAHDRWVRGLAYHPNRHLLASCSQDATIKLWPLAANGEMPPSGATTLKVPRPYEDMVLTNSVGLTSAQRSTLKQLGAITPDLAQLSPQLYSRLLNQDLAGMNLLD